MILIRFQINLEKILQEVGFGTDSGRIVFLNVKLWVRRRLDWHCLIAVLKKGV